MDKHTTEQIDGLLAQFPCLLEGRPNRDTVIDEHDIADLMIALYTTSTVNEFLQEI
jgi:hypothetical protein